MYPIGSASLRHHQSPTDWQTQGNELKERRIPAAGDKSTEALARLGLAA